MADPDARHKLEQQKLEEQAAADKATASASSSVVAPEAKATASASPSVVAPQAEDTSSEAPWDLDNPAQAVEYMLEVTGDRDFERRELTDPTQQRKLLSFICEDLDRESKAGPKKERRSLSAMLKTSFWLL